MLKKLFLLAAAAAALLAQSGLDPQALARIEPRMKEFAEQSYVSGVVTLMQRRGAAPHVTASGWQDIDAKKPMRHDSIFQIMSMTKPVTGVAVMILREEGRLRLLDPVERHLPEFRGQLLIDGASAARALKQPSRPITIRDLMTHTSGMLPNPPPEIGGLLRWLDLPLADAVKIYAQQPLRDEPGTKWVYSNPGIATLGRIVEVASGMPYERFIEERIFRPLGMTDTHVFLPESKHGRLAVVYTSKDGKLVKAGDQTLGGDAMKFRPKAKYSGPEFALYSTAGDLARFYEAMRRGGALDGKRVLSPASVEIMSSVHTGAIKAGWLPGTGFGLTWEVVSDPLGTLTGMTAGCYNHGGAFGTFGWVDPKREMVGVFLIQHAGSRVEARDAFLAMSAAAIVD